MVFLHIFIVHDRVVWLSGMYVCMYIFACSYALSICYTYHVYFADLVPEYLLQPNVDTEIIKILRGGDLTVECVAKTSHPNVNYVWTVPNGGSSFTSLTYAYRNRGTSPIIPAYFGNHVKTNIDLDQAGMYTVQVRLQGINASDPEGVVNAKTNGVVEVQVQSEFGRERWAERLISIWVYMRVGGREVCVFVEDFISDYWRYTYVG